MRQAVEDADSLGQDVEGNQVALPGKVLHISSFQKFGATDEPIL